MISTSAPFPDKPSITLYDPLAKLLGAGDGTFTYTFADAVKLSGHACPTVAGAFLMSVRALQALYPDEIPLRGNNRVILEGAQSQGVNGPISQVFTLITGAAGENGFHGLAGRHQRYGLLEFSDHAIGGFRFQRLDTGTSVTISYDPSSIPPDPQMSPLLQRILHNQAGEEETQTFSRLWRTRVEQILEDAGESTLSVEMG